MILKSLLSFTLSPQFQFVDLAKSQEKYIVAQLGHLVMVWMKERESDQIAFIFPSPLIVKY